MENLPTPLSRVELYLAKACGMDVTVPEEPMSRLEQFLAIIAGDTSIPMPTPMSLTEQWLAYVLGVTPDPLLAVEGACLIGAQKVDVRYFAVAASMPGATLPDNPQNRAEMYWAHIAGNPPTPGILKYVTGTNFYLTDVVSGIEELQYVKGDTYQQTYSGKNIIDFATISYSAANSGSGTRNGATFTVNGASDGNYGGIQFIQSNLQLKTDTTYTFSATVVSTTNTNGSMVYANSAMSSTGSQIFGNNAKAGERTTVTFTTPSSITNSASIRFYPATADATAVFTDIMVEESATATYYEPYTGGIPAPNPDYPQPIQVATGEQTVEVTGKNLFKMRSGTYSNNGLTYNFQENSVTVSGTTSSVSINNLVSNNMTLRKGVTYTVSTSNSALPTGSQLKWRRVSDDNDQAGITLEMNVANASKTFVLDEDIELMPYLRFPKGTTFTDVVIKPQLELGSTATAYEPYQSQTYTISLGSLELCKIGDYQDYIYKSGDDWYVHKETGKVVLNGSESWVVQTRTTSAWNTDKPATLATGETRLLSNYFSEFKTSILDLVGSGIVVGGALNIRNTTITDGDTAGFKTWLSNHNTVIYYPSTTSSDTQITDATLVGQLEAINSAVLPKPVASITIGATSTNLEAILTIAYYGSEE